MRASYILPVTASIHVGDARLQQEASDLLIHSVRLVLRKEILTGKSPGGMASMFTFRRPDDTFVRVEPGPDGGIEAQVVIV